MTGTQLVTAIRTWINRYAVVTPAQSLTLALWVLHTWVYERLGRSTAYLEITGVSGSGKTTVMEALSLLSRGSVILNTLRTLYMCRRVLETDGKVTFFVDEAERLDSSAFGDQRSMLASGYRKGGVHGVSIGKGTETFPSWCPKVFTSLRTVTHVIHNRCIPIWLDRGKPTASLSLDWERAEATAAEIIIAYERLVLTTVAKHVTTVEPTWLSSERDQEIWTPLFSLATTLGVDAATMHELQAASVDLSSLRGVVRRMDSVDEDESAAERSYAVRLIRDVCTVLDGYTDKNVLTRDLLVRLHAGPIMPWRTYGRTGLTDISMGQLIGAFGVETNNTVQVGTGRKGRTVGKGYSVAALRAAGKTAGV